MTELECSATGCVYNSDCYCSKGSICVEGEQAEKVKETCCGDFKEQGSCGCSNRAGEPAKMIDVACKAMQCVHNENEKCVASHIGISGSNACCPSETECAAFVLK